MDKIYQPTGEPMKVFWMFSGGASSLKASLTDKNNGVLYKNVGAYTNKKDAKGIKLCNDNGIPNLCISRKEFYLKHGLDPSHPDSSRRFHEMLLRERIDPEFSPHLICLSGYMRIVDEPLLGYVPITNIHPANLGIIVAPDGTRVDTDKLEPRHARDMIRRGYRRRFTGDNTVYDAIKAGELETRSTLHMLTEVVDGGPILVQSKSFHVGDGVRNKLGDDKWIREYTEALQDVMKTDGDGPAFLKGLELIAQGRLATEGDAVFLDRQELPYHGVRL